MNEAKSNKTLIKLQRQRRTMINQPAHTNQTSIKTIWTVHVRMVSVYYLYFQIVSVWCFRYEIKRNTIWLTNLELRAWYIVGELAKRDPISASRPIIQPKICKQLATINWKVKQWKKTAWIDQKNKGEKKPFTMIGRADRRRTGRRELKITSIPIPISVTRWDPLSHLVLQISKTNPS